jgi:2-polyprenyl-3-methyl-5-hydroxy-6-metoxy-1,4-benzoquinol methylase
VNEPVPFALPDAAALRRMFHRRYGPPEQLGWGPRLRLARGYFTPDDCYEAVVEGLVRPGASWLDVGCGRLLFPSNPGLADELAARCGRLVGLDPDPTLQENGWVHEKVAGIIDDFDGGGAFDVVTLRMVAEHVDRPERCAAAIARALRPGGRAAIYTVCGLSPMPVLTRLAPMSLRHVVKSWLWGTAPKDTFPTRFRMNGRGRLRGLFAGVGMREEAFLRLDDCRTFARFRFLHRLELSVRGLCRAVRLPYPEHCLLGVYRKG